MSIIFKEITNKEQWQNFVFAQKFYSFLQSFEWGQFQILNNCKIFRIGGFIDEQLIGTALIIKIKAKRGTFLFCPHGPLVQLKEPRQFFKEFTNFLKDLGKRERADFIRLSTVLPSTKANAQLLENLGYQFAPMHVHAETTWLLDLNKPEEELLAGMRKTTRYLIKRAETEGVKIKCDQSAAAIEKFIEMHQDHAKKNSYEPFAAAYIRNLFKVFGNPFDAARDRQISLKFALFSEVIEAASVIVYYGKTAVYYLAATNSLHPQFSPSYLLQWRSILEAKGQGCLLYNFWGISPDDNPKHPIFGVSQFKKGFGGRKLDLLHAYDLPLTKKYYLNWLVESLRRKAKGYYFLKPKT